MGNGRSTGGRENRNDRRGSFDETHDLVAASQRRCRLPSFETDAPAIAAPSSSITNGGIASSAGKSSDLFLIEQALGILGVDERWVRKNFQSLLLPLLRAEFHAAGGTVYTEGVGGTRTYLLETGQVPPNPHSPPSMTAFIAPLVALSPPRRSPSLRSTSSTAPARWPPNSGRGRSSATRACCTTP